jgi:YVTN family beta-propeller protein
LFLLAHDLDGLEEPIAKARHEKSAAECRALPLAANYRPAILRVLKFGTSPKDGEIMNSKIPAVLILCILSVLPALAQTTSVAPTTAGAQTVSICGLSTKCVPTIIYVTTTTGAISEIDAATNSIVAVADFPSDSTAAAITPDGRRMYVTDYTGARVLVFNPRSNVPHGQITVGVNPLGLAMTPDGSRLYVVNQGSNSVSVIATSTNTVVATVPVGASPVWITLSADASRAYVVNQGSQTVSIVATASNSIVATISGFATPYYSALDPDGQHLWVSSELDNSVKVVDLATNTIVGSILVGPFPQGIAFTPDGSRAYVANSGSNTVSVIDKHAHVVVGSLTVGNAPAGIGITAQGVAYVANFNDNSISVIDTAINMVTETIPTFGQAQNVTVSTCVRPLVEDFTFTSFDVQGSTDTLSEAINDSGDSVGVYTDGNGAMHGFLRRHGGSITVLDFPGATNTVAVGINNLGGIVGYYTDASGQLHGFQRSVIGSFTTVDFPGAVNTFVFSVNDLGSMVGLYDLGDQSTSIGFLLRQGRFTSIEDPIAASMQTQADGINDFGLVSGLFTDAAGTIHGFLRSPLDGSFRNLDFPVVPGDTFLFQVNGLGLVAGQYDASITHGMLTDGMNFLSVDYPNSHARLAVLRGVNNRGAISGFYRGIPGGPRHGFIATSQVPLVEVLSADD